MIKISPKHGVNPSVMRCFFCGEDTGVALLGRLPDDAKAPRAAVFNDEPCGECAALMKRGVILISVRDGEDGKNPYRTGGFVVLTDEAVGRIFQPPELVADMLKTRVAFVPDEAWNAIGLPPLGAGR